MATKRIGCKLYGMKKIKLFSLVTTALVSVSQPAWAGPHGGGGGFGGGGHFGGVSGGGSRAAPAFSGGGARFGGRTVGGFARAPQFYRAPQFHYGSTRMSAVGPHAFTRSVTRSVTPYAGRRTAINDPSSRVGSMAGRNRVSDPRISRAANRRSFNTNHAFARHDTNWHRDWDRRRAHFDHGNVFVFINGLWYGFYPWDYLPYYGYDYGYPYDYYDYNDYYPYNYDDQPPYVASDQYMNNATVSAVQSELAKRGYYRGAIDGVLGDQTEDAVARYQEDNDLSVTGTVTAAILQSLGLARGAS